MKEILFHEEDESEASVMISYITKSFVRISEAVPHPVSRRFAIQRSLSNSQAEPRFSSVHVKVRLINAGNASDSSTIIVSIACKD